MENTMMKKLWLDDERIEPSGWIRSKSATHAISLLKSNLFDEISLDHDLGEDVFGTGYDVICWLEEMTFTDSSFHIPTIHVHTANSSARSKMMQAAHNIEMLKQRRITENSNDNDEKTSTET